MPTVTVANLTALRGRVVLGLVDTWWARFDLDSDTAPTGGVSIACEDGLALSGTVVQGDAFAGVASVQIVGGAGKLGAPVHGSFRSAQLGDPLAAIARDAGEALASDVDAAVRGVVLDLWTVAGSAAAAIADLAGAAARALGEEVHWRVRPDGKVWIGRESWSPVDLAADVDQVARDPVLRQWTLGVPALTLVPGVEVNGIGRVVAVEHVVEKVALRSLLWTSQSA